MNVDNAIRIFANFINATWEIILPLMKNRTYTNEDDAINDWLQANWELLVERKVINIGEYLNVYGDGADYYGASSRIIDPDALANVSVLVRSKDGEVILDLLNDEYLSLDNENFEKIVGLENGFYKIEPEFKYVLVFDKKEDKERVFYIDDLEFYLHSA